MDLIKKKINLIMEKAEKMLEMNVKGKLFIKTKEIDGKNLLFLDIIAGENDEFETQVNLGIDSQDEIEFYKVMLDSLFEKYLRSDKFGISKYYSIRAEFVGQSFSGLYITSINNNMIPLNFSKSGKEFYQITEDYNKKFKEMTKEDPNLISKVRVPVVDLDDFDDDFDDDFEDGLGNGPSI